MRQLLESNKLNSLHDQGLKVSWETFLPSNIMQIFKDAFPHISFYFISLFIIRKVSGVLGLVASHCF